MQKKTTLRDEFIDVHTLPGMECDVERKRQGVKDGLRLGGGGKDEKMAKGTTS